MYFDVQKRSNILATKTFIKYKKWKSLVLHFPNFDRILNFVVFLEISCHGASDAVYCIKIGPVFLEIDRGAESFPRRNLRTSRRSQRIGLMSFDLTHAVLRIKPFGFTRVFSLSL